MDRPARRHSPLFTVYSLFWVVPCWAIASYFFGSLAYGWHQETNFHEIHGFWYFFGLWGASLALLIALCVAAYQLVRRTAKR